MELALLVYCISLLSGLTGFIAVALTAALIACLFSGIAVSMWAFETSSYSWDLNKDGTLKQTVIEVRALQKRIFKVASITAIVAAAVLIFVPSSKTAWTMVGAYAAQKVAEDPRTAEVGGKVMTIINQQLERIIDEGSKKAAEKIEKATK